MPLSALVQTSKFTTATVVRPYTQGGRTKFQTHSRHTNSQAQHIHVWALTRKRASLALRHHNGPSESVAAGPSRGIHTTHRAQYPCSHKFADIEDLFHGNVAYMSNMSKTNPGLLETLAIKGQRPPFMLVDCSDSRVNEQGIFSAQPGRMFTAGNIANRFDEDDLNSNAVLSFAVETLKVKHVVVLGHYGCGGVAASMMPHGAEPTRPADVAVQGWIQPIRDIYQTSTREEIIIHREQGTTEPLTALPQLHCPAFRALVEENVKSNVKKIANSAVIQDHYEYVLKTNGNGTDSPLSTFAPTSAVPAPDSNPIPGVTEIYIHGWVYDVENGKVSDLGVSVGPPGRELPPSPFPLIGSS